MNRPPVDQKAAEEYANGVMKRLESSPDSLGKHEKRLAMKYQQGKQIMQGLAQEISNVKGRIESDQARLRSLELQIESEQGKCNGFIDYLIDLKFVTEETMPPKGDGKEVSPPSGNGKPVNRKQRRTEASSKSKQKPSIKNSDQPTA